MSDGRMTVGDVVAAFLERCGVELAFGVISIHNMPILDAFHRRGRIRFVPARGEAGATNMADASARVSGRLGVAVTSTGTAAGNAAGALVEAATAGTPLLHLTGQIDSPFLDRGFGFLHEARDQLGMLRAVSKAAFRIAAPAQCLQILREAVRMALTPPTGPVSVEIPIDVQQSLVESPADLVPLPLPVPAVDAALIDELAERVAKARRPLLWLGGGARHAGEAVQKLVAMGFGVVTSTAGRGILAEDHPASLGAFTAIPSLERLYASVDLLLVAGSHLRSNETRTYTLPLPRTRIRIDADPEAEGRGYDSDMFICGDAAAVLDALATRLGSRPRAIDPRFGDDIVAARRSAEDALRTSMGPYAALLDALARQMPPDALWVRDITLSNSIWGNRAPPLRRVRSAVHAMGGGIGQGLPMALGAALGAPGRRTVALIGDGGFALSLGELATVAEAWPDLVILLMNDGGYGVIRNIQDSDYGGRRCYADIKAPHFGRLAESLDIPHRFIRDLADFSAIFASALTARGPTIIEIDMRAIGPFAIKFGGFPSASQTTR
ncbi:MAG: thiamine pyrophosphate-binding protein [Stellaceae bacterium]